MHGIILNEILATYTYSNNSVMYAFIFRLHTEQIEKSKALRWQRSSCLAAVYKPTQRIYRHWRRWQTPNIKWQHIEIAYCDINNNNSNNNENQIANNSDGTAKKYLFFFSRSVVIVVVAILYSFVFAFLQFCFFHFKWENLYTDCSHTQKKRNVTNIYDTV